MPNKSVSDSTLTCKRRRYLQRQNIQEALRGFHYKIIVELLRSPRFLCSTLPMASTWRRHAHVDGPAVGEQCVLWVERLQQVDETIVERSERCLHQPHPLIVRLGVWVEERFANCQLHHDQRRLPRIHRKSPRQTFRTSELRTLKQDHLALTSTYLWRTIVPCSRSMAYALESPLRVSEVDQSHLIAGQNFLSSVNGACFGETDTESHLLLELVTTHLPHLQPSTRVHYYVVWLDVRMNDAVLVQDCNRRQQM